MTRGERILMRKRVAIVLGAAAALVAALVPGVDAGPQVETQIVADAGAQAFAVRPSYDSGGATPLNFYIGYTEANVSTPEPQADGQASWYNFGIAETPAFRPPEECTPERNLGATTGDDGGDGSVQDLRDWLVEYQQQFVADLQAGRQPLPPTAPSFRHACTERLPGFTQSRYPATHRCEEGTCSGIRQSDRDDLLTKPFCKDPGACTAWQSFDGAAGTLLADGSFSSNAGEMPSDDSAAALAGLGDGTTISIGFAFLRSNTALQGRTVLSEATSTLHDVCLMRSAAGCALHIDEMRQVASVRVAPSAKPVRTQRTVLTGVHRLGDAAETEVIVVDGSDVEAIRVTYDGGTNDDGSSNGQLMIQPVSASGGCTPVQGASSYAIADAGGLRIFGKGSSGGGIVVGGACARARINEIELAPVIPAVTDPVPGVPASTVVINGPPLACPACTGRPQVVVGPPRVVTRELVSYRTRGAPAWRSAGAWGPALGTLVALIFLGWLFRTRPAMRPVVVGLNRFARQFIKG